MANGSESLAYDEDDERSDDSKPVFEGRINILLYSTLFYNILLYSTQYSTLLYSIQLCVAFKNALITSRSFGIF